MPIRFAIAFVGRSGSFYLQSRIDSHPDANCHGEILWPIYNRETNETTAEYIDVHAADATNRAQGFKLPQQHIKGLPEVVDILAEREFRIIRLFRHNKLDQFISLKLAQKTGYWWSAAGSYGNESVTINPQEFQATVAKDFLGGDQFIETTFQSFPSISVAYEEVVAGPGWGRVRRFLELSDASTRSEHEKQQKRPRRDVVSNYDELLEHFRGTELEEYFTS